MYRKKKRLELVNIKKKIHVSSFYVFFPSIHLDNEGASLYIFLMDGWVNKLIRTNDQLGKRERLNDTAKCLYK